MDELADSNLTGWVVNGLGDIARRVLDLHRPTALLARTWSASGMALGVMVILLAYLLGYYVL